MSEVAPYESPTSEARRIFTLAWPVSLGMVGFTLMSTVDLIVASSLGIEALASLGIGNMWVFGITVFGLGAARGVDPIVAQSFGASDSLEPGRTLLRAWVLGLCVSIPLMAAHLFTAEGLLLLGQPPPLLDGAASYAFGAMWGLPFAVLFTVNRQFLQAMRIMKPAMVAVMAATGVNLALNALFVWKLGLGIMGIGLATSLSWMFMLAVLVGLTWDTLSAAWPGWTGVMKTEPVVKLVSLAVPAGLQSVVEVWGFIIAGLMMGWLGMVQIDAHIMAMNLASVSFMLPFGVAAAATTRVGNLIGAGHDWWPTAKVSIAMSIAVMSVSTVLFATMPAALLGVYTSDPAVIAAALVIMPAAAAFQVFDGIQTTSMGVPRGAGDLTTPTLVDLVGFCVVGLPIGYWLAFERGWGPLGIWTGLGISLATVAMLLVARLFWLRRTGVAPVVKVA